MITTKDKIMKQECLKRRHKVKEKIKKDKIAKNEKQKRLYE
jgi:hypothetical protein